MGSASHLRLVADSSWAEEQVVEEQILFCSHCASRPAGPVSATRVCTSCGFGVLLEAGASGAPDSGDAFLVVDRSMSICAVSRGAEELLEITEVQAVHRHLGELLTPADTEAQSNGNLAFAVSAAVSGSPETKRFTLRPSNLFGVRLSARILACGPRPGALVRLD